MLDPNTNAIDFTALGDVPPEVVTITRQREPDKSHPLVRIHLIVDRACTGRCPRPASNVGPGHVVDQRIVRAAILQSLYSFGCNELLMEHLHYNTLYRWFVGLKDGEQPWSAASYADALARVLGSDEGAGVLRTALLQAVSCAAVAPDRFCVDSSLVERWTSKPRSLVKSDTSTSTATTPANSDRCHARLERARDIILRRISDHDLTPESIAAEMCMSRRALFMLFEKQGLTPTRVIRDLRLDHSRKLLTDARHRHRKITDIALDFGFSHPGTFSRKFKDRFGVSPVDVRSGGGVLHRRNQALRYSEVSGAS